MSPTGPMSKLCSALLSVLVLCSCAPTSSGDLIGGGTGSTTASKKQGGNGHQGSKTDAKVTEEPTADNEVLLGVSFTQLPGFVGEDLGQVSVGQSVTRVVAIVNHFPTSVQVDVSISGEGFSLVEDRCSGTVLETQGTCRVGVRFTAPDTEERVGSVDVSSSSGGAGLDLRANHSPETGPDPSDISRTGPTTDTVTEDTGTHTPTADPTTT